MNLLQMDEEAAAEAYASFVSSFDEQKSQVKTFVKGSTLNSDKSKQLYMLLSLPSYCTELLLVNIIVNSYLP